MHIVKWSGPTQCSGDSFQCFYLYDSVLFFLFFLMSGKSASTCFPTPQKGELMITKWQQLPYLGTALWDSNQPASPPFYSGTRTGCNSSCLLHLWAHLSTPQVVPQILYLPPSNRTLLRVGCDTAQPTPSVTRCTCTCSSEQAKRKCDELFKLYRAEKAVFFLESESVSSPWLNSASWKLSGA